MFPNKEKIRQFLNKEKSILKTKTFWIIVITGILFFIGTAISAYSFLQLPFGILVAGVMPGIFAIKFSVPLAMKFIHMHKKWNKIRHKNYSYEYNPIDVKNPSTLKFALMTTAYSFAIIYNVLNWTGLDELVFKTPRMLPVLAGITLLSLFSAIIIHVSIFLLTKIGFMYQDPEDRSKINLGREMEIKFGDAISPILLISLVYSIATKSNDLSLVLGASFGLFIVTLYSSFFSFYFLKKVHLKKILEYLREQVRLESDKI